MSQWDDTRYGHYRGLRWLILLREIAWLLPSLLVVWRMRSQKFDVIHVNEITLLLCGILARQSLRAPLVVHVRSLQRGTSGGLRTRLMVKLLRKFGDAIVAIDETVRATLPSDLPIKVIHNTVARPPRGTEPPTTKQHLRVASVSVLHENKGIYEFAEAARVCRDRGLPVDFLIVGENARDCRGLRGWLLRRLKMARDVRRDIDEFVARYGLERTVSLVGFLSDVGRVYRDIDVLCFPSRLNAPGRPVFEAAFHGVPSIVVVDQPSKDTIVPGVTGLCLERADPVLLADAIERMYRNPEERRRMGEKARELAERYFDSSTNAALLGDVYTELALGRRQP